ncbi:type VI secretion system baseplate subunit TssE [Metakosakonia massiliensis]|uniref:Gene 25-like lysozyme n=1 Tax=Phytobacter massiliensis TaxID=1485952 RepID=A0A6N3AGX3_9ENTR|nr:type VI secretion system baseplate subunit TssE [Phytobacter massiliensis]
MAALLRWDNPQQSLFERIRLRADPFKTTDIDLIASIRQNLSQVLNTRPGGSQSTPALGIIDMNDAMMDSSELNLVVCQSIRDCILRYEPRISAVTVTTCANPDQSSDPLTLNFRIIADVQEENAITRRVEFQLHMDHEQHYYLV